jgi:hypothetical protein
VKNEALLGKLCVFRSIRKVYGALIPKLTEYFSSKKIKIKIDRKSKKLFSPTIATINNELYL